MPNKNWPHPLESLPTPRDFKTEAQLRRQCASGKVAGVYLLLDGEDVVYVGQSMRMLERIRQHEKDGVKDFTSARFCPVRDDVERLQIETILIAGLLPKYNRGLCLGLSGGDLWEVRWSRAPGRRRRG